ncbi:D-amino acid dehydrogenase small subunit [Delftia tsuruhatensis]|uniref:NAD(P)/FAD-dependent oxidoreductase n=1 Tax=Delftia tsuruhatensis TaxID=180282 RepID=UPI001E795AE2|nr:FAD-dependent oxidoreductase [Delftia tsuruhatensis]CAB5661290.1 D-amino acid dehydrogenase small subunit [Delftia tsuruhatensis]CAC9680064.1 D-amino acid dehydrogenase small subunit [Delftia tsuruhatensis]
MNIAIVGAGSIGVATAHALAQAGHEVTVYERHGTAAEEASFGHAGWLGPSLLQPWSLPGTSTPRRSPTLPGRQALPRLGSGGLASQLGWLWQWRQARRGLLRNGQPTPAMAALEALTQHSQQLQQSLWRQWEFDPEYIAGSLVLLGSEAEHELLKPALAALAEAGTRCELLDAAQTRLREPSLGEDAQIAGALYFPQAGAANGRLATLMQRQVAQTGGARFETQRTVRQLLPGGGGRTARLLLQDEEQPRTHEAIVLCAGADAPGLLATQGIRLPLTPLHGYGVSAPLRELSYAPRHAIVDWSEQMNLVRLGQRMRIVAGAELGRRGPMHEATLQRMYHRLNMLFPGSAVLASGVQIWQGTRMCTSDGLPLLGASGLPGIWLNLGHGSCGAAIAQGCASLLADLIGQRPVFMDTSLLDPRRFG